MLNRSWPTSAAQPLPAWGKLGLAQVRTPKPSSRKVKVVQIVALLRLITDRKLSAVILSCLYANWHRCQILRLLRSYHLLSSFRRNFRRVAPSALLLNRTRFCSIGLHSQLWFILQVEIAENGLNLLGHCYSYSRKTRSLLVCDVMVIPQWTPWTADCLVLISCLIHWDIRIHSILHVYPCQYMFLICANFVYTKVTSFRVPHILLLALPMSRLVILDSIWMPSP